MKKIIIIGLSGHAKVLVDIIEKQKVYELVGFTDKVYENGISLSGYPLLGNDEEIPHIIEKYDIYGGVVAIGDNYLREVVVNKLKKIYPRFKFVTLIHPSAQIGKGATIGEGSVVMANCVISVDTAVGEHCILNTASILEHESIVDAYVSFAPGVMTGGNCVIRRSAALGIGAVLKHNIEIGEASVVGAGALVLSDVPSYKVAYGVPAKIIKSRKKETPYL